MKAIVYEKYGPPEVLELREVEKPNPKDNQVLIRTYATTVTSGDRRVRSLNVPIGFGLITRLVFGVSKPKQPILGSELAGVVESVGKDVRRFNVGDQVFAFSDASMGCHAEYKCMPEEGTMVLMPANLTYGEAAALSFGGTTALDFFKRGNLQRGEKVLVNGASGGVGTAAVQLARHFGADVTGVCTTANFELVRSLGASHVIDYTKDDFTRNGKTYDVIVDTVGTAPFSRSKVSLKEGGRLLMILAGLPDMLQIPWVSITGSKKLIAGPATVRVEDLRFLAQLAEVGAFKPVIDRRYPFEQIAEAHRYVDTGRKRGNVVITMGLDVPTLVRPATRADVPGMHRVRLAVRENRLTTSAITEEHYPPAIEQTGKGWVAMHDNQVCGFAVGNKETGNIWALFVDPAAEAKGLGRKLHDEMTSWLFAQGLERLWLGTEPGTRAQRFYERAGWRFVRNLPDGEALYELRKPNLANATFIQRTNGISHPP